MNLSYDILKKVFYIKIKVSSYLKNITDNTIEKFATISQVYNNKYIYLNNDTTYTLTKNHEQEIILKRENPEISHIMIFCEKKLTKSEYFLKEYHNSLEFTIKTNKIEIINNKIKVSYKILETENEYEYIIEMSDKL